MHNTKGINNSDCHRLFTLDNHPDCKAGFGRIGRNIHFKVAVLVFPTPIKFAFPAGKLGTVSTSMHQSAETINLVIADNGIGIDPTIAKTGISSVGLNLIKGLTGEIDGKINIVNENATTIAISSILILHQPVFLAGGAKNSASHPCSDKQLFPFTS